jgi:hypothetical protein
MPSGVLWKEVGQTWQHSFPRRLMKLFLRHQKSLNAGKPTLPHYAQLLEEGLLHDSSVSAQN